MRQERCVACNHQNADATCVAVDELARSAPAAALVLAARTDAPDNVEEVYRSAHAHAAKSCDNCHAQSACKVDLHIKKRPRALVLSVGWFATDADPDEVTSLCRFVERESIDASRVFSAEGRKAPCTLDLLAIVVFKDAHYTAFVRSADGEDAWTYHDRRSTVAVGNFEAVVTRCRDGPMLPRAARASVSFILLPPRRSDAVDGPCGRDPRGSSGIGTSPDEPPLRRDARH